MKTSKLIGITFLSVMLGACSSSSQSDENTNSQTPVIAEITANTSTSQMNQPVLNDKQIDELLNGYFQIKDALVASNTADAKTAINKMKASLKNIGNKKIELTALSEIDQAKTLNDQRMAFKALSQQMTELVKMCKLKQGNIYLDYCPMAQANWLSTEKEIQNPYFGEKMMTCGNIQETID